MAYNVFGRTLNLAQFNPILTFDLDSYSSSFHEKTTCAYNTKTDVVSHGSVSCLVLYKRWARRCLRHCLVDEFNSVSHGELVHDALRRLHKVYLPRFILHSESTNNY